MPDAVHGLEAAARLAWAAFGSAALLAAAAVLHRLWRNQAREDRTLLLLIALAALAGAGGMVMALTRQLGPLLPEFIPLQAFVLIFAALGLRRFLGVSPAASAVLLAAAVLAGLKWIEVLPPALGSTGFYLPALAFLALLGLSLIVRARIAGYAMLMRGQAAISRQRIEAGARAAITGRRILAAALVLAGALALRLARDGIFAGFPAAASLWPAACALALFLLVKAALDHVKPLPDDEA